MNDWGMNRHGEKVDGRSFLLLGKSACWKVTWGNMTYCWWKKSCTSWYGEYPIIDMVLYISGGAGFHPSTVSPKDTDAVWLGDPIFYHGSKVKEAGEKSWYLIWSIYIYMIFLIYDVPKMQPFGLRKMPLKSMRGWCLEGFGIIKTGQDECTVEPKLLKNSLFARTSLLLFCI